MQIEMVNVANPILRTIHPPRTCTTLTAVPVNSKPCIIIRELPVDDRRKQVIPGSKKRILEGNHFVHEASGKWLQETGPPGPVRNNELFL